MTSWALEINFLCYFSLTFSKAGLEVIIFIYAWKIVWKCSTEFWSLHYFLYVSFCIFLLSQVILLLNPAEIRELRSICIHQQFRGEFHLRRMQLNWVSVFVVYSWSYPLAKCYVSYFLMRLIIQVHFLKVQCLLVAPVQILVKW